MYLINHLFIPGEWEIPHVFKHGDKYFMIPESEGELHDGFICGR